MTNTGRRIFGRDKTGKYNMQVKESRAKNGESRKKCTTIQKGHGKKDKKVSNYA